MRKSEVLAAESVACLNKALCRLKDIWEEIGIPEDQRLQRTEVVKKHVRGLLDMMIAEEESLKQRLMNSIETCRKELDDLCKELQLPPFEDEDGSSMLQLEKDIRTRLEVMLKQKNQRMQELKGLQDQERDLCDVLCTGAYIIDPACVPTLEQLEAFQQHIAGLVAEKEQRHAEFVDIKKQIILCMEDLEQVPDTSFERDVVYEEEEAFCLSKENIKALKLLLAQLEERKAENEALCSSYRRQIQELWDRLQVPQVERDQLSEHMVTCKKRNMEALAAELQRLDQLKMENIRVFTEAVRAELASYWEKCFFSAEQQQDFVPYHHEEFSEELLRLHEDELQRLRQHFEEHQELYEGVHQWQENWLLFLELEKKATDPSRFTNRGGNLLKEEKQRADLQKNLPKLEKKLKAQIDVWEQEQGREFLIDGKKFLQFVEEQWELHRTEKERERVERQLKKSKQTEEDMLYGTAVRTPSKRRLPGSTTPGKTRKLNATSSISSATPNSTMRSVFGGTICHSPMSRPPLSAAKPGLSSRTPGHGRPPRSALMERNKENITQAPGSLLRGVLRTPASPQRNYSINSIASTYSEFARELSKASKSNCKTGALNSTITHR
ncbi:protein regulator of cytokinesis 1-like isoform X2 [Paramormyrops kingsleyae]|uniref:Protein regulator of cytokinesis 1a n=1 Tax=Paramormyrops kingsleyae TaxID=1676925 RepID=A0A3B3Q9X8_9TELE|nr:protein regulator of cytokinesis 1-like isoform X2 [Paramormyrops kingsleyae]